MNKKALVLLSGGLDSILSVALMKELGVEVEAVNFAIRFCGCFGKGASVAAKKAADMLKVPLTVFDITEEYLEMYKNPKYGFGANVNPCIDCKIIMLKKAKEYMSKAGASFIVTGEVLGERPMSQRGDMLRLIEKQSGLKGLLLRPLSAKLLEPTIPELEGIVDREKLLDIKGRGRRPQMELAKKLGIKEYPNAGGGCLLTDPGYAKRVKDLVKYNALDLDNLMLATVGRNYRISPETKLAVGRNEKENSILESYLKDEDISFNVKDVPGPYAILRGRADDAAIELAASIVAYHTKLKDKDSVVVEYWKGRATDAVKTIPAKPATLETAESLRI
jgi:tRNA U34 2-thiouridine synthase MnmA/TrmU